MQEIIQKINSFFSEIRKKDQETKKQWLIGLTSASMLIVLVLWIISMNLTIKKLGGQEKIAAESGIGSTFYQGLKVVGGKVGGSLSEISDQIQSYVETTNSVTIQPTNLNFSNNIEPVTPKKFP